MIPLIWYTGRKTVMGPYVNRHITTIVAVIIGATIIALNVDLLYTSI
jgi:manganese transport protein